MYQSRLVLALAVPFLTLGFAFGSAVRTAEDPVEGFVREEGSGSAIVSARVELRVGAQLVATGRTDATGFFRLQPREAWSEQWELSVARLGYVPFRQSVPMDLAPLEIVLEPAPLPLPEFRVEREVSVCDRSDDDAAREIWRLATQRHARGLDTLGIASYTLARTDTLVIAQPIEAGSDAAESGQRASAPLLRMSWNRRVEREGYAFPVRRSDRDRSYDSWSYPPLEADFAPHFVNETFGRLHRFHLDSADETGWVLRFCGQRMDRPFLEGSIEIGRDTLIRRAEWHFRTPDPDESAGGWAEFVPTDESGSAPPLLPTESMIWRALSDERMVRRAQWYEEWVVAPGDSVPFLPERRAASPDS